MKIGKDLNQFYFSFNFFLSPIHYEQEEFDSGHNLDNKGEGNIEIARVQDVENSDLLF